MLTDAHIKWLAPHAHADYVAALTSEYGWSVLGHYGIVGRPSWTRLSGFLANVLVETGGFTIGRESLAYTSPDRLRHVWPSRFKNLSDAELAQYLHNEPALADKAYGGRMGNRPGTTDAFDYRGWGMLQCTGREDTIRYCKVAGIDVEADPSKLDDKNVSLVVACAEWAADGCNEMLDADNFDEACVAINAGLGALKHVRSGKLSALAACQSLPERQQQLRRVQKMFGLHADEVAGPYVPDPNAANWADDAQDAEQDAELVQ